MLSRERALKFLSDMLQISDPEKKLKDNRLKLLSLVISEFQAKIPFQDLSVLSVPVSKRRPPTVEESVLDCEKGKGGLCYTTNVFLKVLLEALGYSAYHTMANACGYPESHIMTIAADVVTPGDKYVVEAGNGFVTELVPLNFDKESPVFNECLVKYKYVWEDGLLKRYNLRGEKKGEPRWAVFYESDMVPKDVSLFEAPFSSHYSDPKVWSTMGAIKFPDSKAVCICNMKLLLEDDSHTLQETKLESEAEFLAAVKEHFPLLEEDAKKALTNWTPTGDLPVQVRI